MKLGGCAIVTISRRYFHKYDQGEIVYIIAKAKKGNVVPVAIREVQLKNINGNYLSPLYLYKDTTNAYWNESELCSNAEALAFATEFWTARAAALAELERIRQCAA